MINTLNKKNILLNVQMIRQNRLNRLGVILVTLSALGMITFFVLKALQSNINFYLTPTQAIEKGYENLNTFKLGGMVKLNSVQKEGLNTKFYVTDYDNETLVTFRGVLPNLFKENSGVVALGYFDTNEEIFVAKEILAKHDENYSPVELNSND